MENVRSERVKKKLILMCTAGVLVMTAVIGGTMAGFNTSTDSKGVSNITVKELGITLNGQNTGKELDAYRLDDIAAVPGGEVEVPYSITNNVEGGYELYTRVTIYKKWEETDLDQDMIHLYVKEGNEDKELLAGTTVNDWIVWYADGEQVIMYYTKPLGAGATSSELISSVRFDDQMGNAYAGKKVSLAFEADAVQTIAAEDSIPSEWGVYPVIAADGTIGAIEE